METRGGITAVGDWCLWLYGVVEGSTLTGFSRDTGDADPGQITFVHFRELACAAAKVQASYYSGMPEGGTERVDWLAPRAMRHHQTLHLLMGQATVVPFKFGSICASAEQVSEILRARYDQLRSLLTRFRGVSEWAVRVFVDEKRVVQLLHQTDPQLQAISALMTERPAGEAYLLGRKMQNLAGLLANARYLSLEQDVYERLQHCAVDIASSRRLYSQSEPSRVEVVSTAVLMPNERFTDLEGILGVIERDYVQLGVASEASGPWPPYSFSEIELQPLAAEN